MIAKFRKPSAEELQDQLEQLSDDIQSAIRDEDEQLLVNLQARERILRAKIAKAAVSDIEAQLDKAEKDGAEHQRRFEQCSRENAAAKEAVQDAERQLKAAQAHAAEKLCEMRHARQMVDIHTSSVRELVQQLADANAALEVAKF